MGLELKITHGKKEINLTDFTIVDFNHMVEDIKGRNEFLARNVQSIEIFGCYSLFDKNDESMDAYKLECWAKKTAHDKSVYRKVKLTLKDNNDEIYDEIKFKKGFIVKFSEGYKSEKGMIEFYALIREFNDEILAKDGKSVNVAKAKVSEIATGESLTSVVLNDKDNFSDEQYVNSETDSGMEFSALPISVYYKFYTADTLDIEFDNTYLINKVYDLNTMKSYGYKLDKKVVSGIIPTYIYSRPYFLSYERSVSTKLISFIRQYEGFSSIPYVGQDSYNKTIGFGHVIQPGENLTFVTEKQGMALLASDMKIAIDEVNKFLKSNKIHVNQNQFDALIDFTFNGGLSWLVDSNSANLKNMLISRNYTKVDIKNEFLSWSHVTENVNGVPTRVASEGVYRRKYDDAQMFNDADYKRDYPNMPSSFK